MKEEKQKYQLGKVNFTQEPILPVFSEVFQRYPWVFYGENNQMPAYLISRYNNCAIHKAVVISKREQIMGDGLVSFNNPMATINLINNKENVYDVMKKCALDLVLFGGYALNVIWSRDRKSIAEIYHLDFSRVRCGKINEDSDQIEKFYYSAEWGNIRKFPPTEYDAFNQEDGDPSQIYYYKQYSPSNSYYPQPDYSGAIAAINIDVQIKEFHSNNLMNGMMPSLWINMNNGIPGEEEQRLVTRALESQFTSVNNAGRPIISFNESKELSPEITQIATSGNDQYYATIYDDIVRTILSSHRVSSGELYGISTAGKLGTRNEIVDHSEYFRKMVIQPYQKELLVTFDKLVSMKFQKPTTFDIKPLSIFLEGDVNETATDDAQKVLDGINSLSPLVANKVLESMTPNEIRSLVNLDPTPDGDVIPVVAEIGVTDTVTPIEAEAQLINENIKGLKGREYQNLMRIVREFNKGKISRQQAAQMLMAGYGLSEEDCAVWLGEDEEENDY
jgi:hypothetical protein